MSSQSRNDAAVRLEYGKSTPPPQQPSQPAAFRSPEATSPRGERAVTMTAMKPGRGASVVPSLLQPGGAPPAGQQPAAANASNAAALNRQIGLLKTDMMNMERKLQMMTRDAAEKDGKISEMQDTISKLESSKAAALKAKVEGENHSMRTKSVESRNRELNERIEAIRASAAEREATLTKRASDLEAAGQQWKSYGDEAAKKHEDLRSAYCTLEQSFRTAQEELSKHQKAYADAARDVRQLKDDNARLNTRCNELAASNARLDEEVRASHMAVNEVTAARQRDESHLFQMHEVEQRMRDDVVAARTQCRKAEEQLQTVTAMHENELRRCSALEDRVAELAQNAARADEDRKALLNRIDDGQRENQRLKLSLDAATATSRHLQSLIDQSKHAEQTTISKLDEQASETAQRSRELTQARLDLQNVQMALKLKEHEVAMMQAEVVSAKHEAETAKARAAAAQQEVTEAHATASTRMLSAEQQRTVFEEQRLHLEQRVAVLQADAIKLAAEAEQSRNLAEEAQKRMEVALTKSGTAVESVKEIVAARHRAETELANKAAAMQDLEVRHARVQESLAATCDTVAEVRTALDASREQCASHTRTIDGLNERLAIQTEACRQLSVAHADSEVAWTAATKKLHDANAQLLAAKLAAEATSAANFNALSSLLHDEMRLPSIADGATFSSLLAVLRDFTQSHTVASETHAVISAKLKQAQHDLETAQIDKERLQKCLDAASSESSSYNRRAMSLENQLNTVTHRATLEKETMASDLQRAQRDLALVQRQLQAETEDSKHRLDDAHRQLRQRDEEVSRARSESAITVTKTKAAIGQLDSDLEKERSSRISAEARAEKLASTVAALELKLAGTRDAESRLAKRHQEYKDALDATKKKLRQSEESRKIDNERLQSRCERYVRHRDEALSDFEELARHYKDLAAAFRDRGGRVERDLGAEHSTRVSHCIENTARVRKQAATHGDDTTGDKVVVVAASSAAATRDSNVLGALQTNPRPERKSVSFDPRIERRAAAGGGESDSEATPAPQGAAEPAPLMKRNRAE